ncbi:MAG: hypothetical protein IJZ89_00715 [Clostridia bacterium]|nr:hypothetical protein [Clostridia bacterium]
MENSYEKLEKKRKLTEGIFMGIILVLFLVFLILWLKVESMIPRYIVGAVLLIAALAYKNIDKKLKAEAASLRPRDESDPEFVRTGLFAELWEEYENGEMRRFFEEKTVVDVITDEYVPNMIDIRVKRKGTEMSFNIAEDSVYMSAGEIDETVCFENIGSIEKFYKILDEFIVRNSPDE